MSEREDQGFGRHDRKKTEGPGGKLADAIEGGVRLLVLGGPPRGDRRKGVPPAWKGCLSCVGCLLTAGALIVVGYLAYEFLRLSF